MVQVVNLLIHFLRITMRRIGLWPLLIKILHRKSNSHPKSVVIKVGMVGDSQIGKTSLMVKYVEGSFDEDYIQTLGKLLRKSTHSAI